MWVQIKVTLFNALVALLLWIGLQDGPQLLPLRVRQDLPLHRGGLDKLTRNVALFFLATAIVNEAVRLGFADAHIVALNRVFTGIDIWILFKIFVVMPVTALFFWWQVRLLQKYRLPEPIATIAARSDTAPRSRATRRCGLGTNSRSNTLAHERGTEHNGQTAAARPGEPIRSSSC